LIDLLISANDSVGDSVDIRRHVCTPVASLQGDRGQFLALIFDCRKIVDNFFI